MNPKWPLIAICSFIAAISAPSGLRAQSVPWQDEDLAKKMNTQFPDADYGAPASREEFTFEKGNKVMGTPVVSATRQETTDLIGMKGFTTFAYYQYYNRFVDLKKFSLFKKHGSRYDLERQQAGDQASAGENIFQDDNRIQNYSIAFKEKGEIARVMSELYFRDSKYLTRVFFHSYYPIGEKIIRFVVPQWLQLDLKEMNFDGYTITRTVTTEKENTIYTYTMKDIEAVTTEKNQIGFALTYPHLVVTIRSFEQGGSLQTGLHEPADLYKWYNLLYSSCKNDPSLLKTQVDLLTKDKTGNTDKIKSIYYWVQDNIRYFAFEDGYAGFVPETAQKVLQDKFGDCKGMANLLTEMLKLAGFDAHFTWIGTRSLPYDHAETAAICVDNHAICTLYLEGKTYFLDATESYAPFGENAYRIQGKSALVQKGSDFAIERVPVSGKNANRIATHAEFHLQGNVLKGHVRMTLTGNERTGFLQYYQSLSVDKKQRFLKSVMQFGNDNLTASLPVVSDLNNRELPITLESDIDLSNNITSAGGETFASIDFFPRSLNSFLPDANRKRGYDFQSLFTYEDSIQLSVPAGFKFVDLPEAIADDHAGYSFHGSYLVKDNTILLQKSFAIENSRIKKQDFGNWTAFLKKIKSFNNSQITIVKQ